MYTKINNIHFTDELENVPKDNLKIGDLISIIDGNQLNLLSLSAIKNQIFYKFKYMEIENSLYYSEENEEDSLYDEENEESKEDSLHDEDREENSISCVKDTNLCSSKEKEYNYLLLPNGKFLKLEENNYSIHKIDELFYKEDNQFVQIIKECQNINDFYSFKNVNKERLYYSFCISYNQDIKVCFLIENNINFEKLQWCRYNKIVIIDFKSNKFINLHCVDYKFDSVIQSFVNIKKSEKDFEEKYELFKKFNYMKKVEMRNYLYMNEKEKTDYENLLRDFFENEEFYPFERIINSFYRPFYKNENLNLTAYFDIHSSWDSMVLLYIDDKRIYKEDETEEIKNECDVSKMILYFIRNGKNGISPYDGETYKNGVITTPKYELCYEDCGGKILLDRPMHRYLYHYNGYYFFLDHYDPRIREIEDRRKIINKLVDN